VVGIHVWLVARIAKPFHCALPQDWRARWAACEVVEQPSQGHSCAVLSGRTRQHAAQRAKRGVFHCLASLQEGINRFVAQANTEPKRFRWAKDPDTIIAAVRRGHQVLDYSG
jgi:hypothetical protein